MCVCAHSRGYKLHPHDTESVQAVKQVCYIKKCNKATMHGHDHCNEAHHDRNQLNNKAMLVP